MKGVVKDRRTGLPIGKVRVDVKDRLHHTVTTDRGEFWRLLLPGEYVLKVWNVTTDKSNEREPFVVASFVALTCSGRLLTLTYGR